MDKSAKLKSLIEKREKYRRLIEKKRMEVGESDGPMVSRFPTGRFELEQEIEELQVMLKEINSEIKKLDV